MYILSHRNLQIYLHSPLLFPKRKRKKEKKNCDSDKAMWGSQTGKKKEKRGSKMHRGEQGEEQLNMEGEKKKTRCPV